MSVRDSRSSRLHAGQRRGGRGLHDGPTTTLSASTSKSSSFHSPGEREARATLIALRLAPQEMSCTLLRGGKPVLTTFNECNIIKNPCFSAAPASTPPPPL